MLRSFRFANHKSFRDEAELLLMPTYDKSGPVVPVAGVFGANASGKSNLLDALRWMQAAVRESYANWEPGAGVPRSPFRLDPDARAEPSLYSVEIVADGQRYAYGLKVASDRVLEEWLYTYPHGRRRVIFERELKSIRLGSTLPDYRTRGEQLTRQTRDNALFLSVAAHNDLAEVQPVYQWFRSGVRFVPDAVESVRERLTRWLASERRDMVVALIRAADLGITDVTVQPYVTLTELVFQHGSNRAPLTLDEQSAGTKGWLAFIVRALPVLEAGGGVLVVDEVDASLHPHLVAQLINLFRDHETNHVGAQLLFTTHDATLLDEETLSRDEIWFVEKDPETGRTRLFPLTDFHPRKHENTEGRYLAGAYGAVPVLSDRQFRRAVAAGRRRDVAA
jgi:uncharacterized protein